MKNKYTVRELKLLRTYYKYMVSKNYTVTFDEFFNWLSKENRVTLIK